MKTEANQKQENKNFIVQGTDSKKFFIVQKHPRADLRDDFYYLTSMDSETKNRTERKKDIDDKRGYVSFKEKLIVTP